MTSIKNIQGTPLVIRAFSKIPPHVVYDLGAGVGRDSLYLATIGNSVVAVDQSRAELEILQAKAADMELPEAQVRTVVSRIQDFVPEKPGSFVANVSLHFLTLKERKAVIEWMQANTEVGGANVVTGFLDLGTALGSFEWFTEGELEAYYKIPGWKIETIEISTTRTYPGEDGLPRWQEMVGIIARRAM